MASESGGQPGNDNSARGKEFRQALKRALARKANDTDYRKGLDLIADELVKSACKGESWAVKEIAEREDGKARQEVDLSGTVNHDHTHAADESGLPALAALIAEAAGSGAAGSRKKAVPH